MQSKSAPPAWRASRRTVIAGLAAGIAMGSEAAWAAGGGSMPGFAYVGCRTSRERNARGDGISVYRIGADGGMTRMLTGIGVSNGLDWSPDGTVFYYTDSMRRTIWRFPFDPVEGTLGERSVFVALGAESGNPDGLTVDEEGFVWCAVWDGSRIIRFGPGGSIDRLVEMPVPRPTSLCFGGPDLSILYVTSARIGLSPDALAAAPLSGALFAVETGVRGLPSRPAVLK